MRMFQSLVFVVMIILLTSCGAGEMMKVNGRFVYSTGGGTLKVSTVRDSVFTTSKLYESKKVGTIAYLTVAQPDTVYFDECYVTDGCVIKRYTLDSGESDVLRTGKMPTYVLNHKKLFFYDKDVDGEDWLFEGSIEDVNVVKKVAKKPHDRRLKNGVMQPIVEPALQISKDEIVFVGEGGQLREYNILNKKVTSLEVNDCRPVLWRSKYRQLLCQDFDTWQPFLLSMDSKERTSLPKLNGGYGFSHVPKYDVLVYGRTRLKFMIDEVYDIYMYSFKNNEENRVISNSHITSGIWID